MSSLNKCNPTNKDKFFNEAFRYRSEILEKNSTIMMILLKDRTTDKNIYIDKSSDENKSLHILDIDDIKGIQPRYRKDKRSQKKRTIKNAEVFTPQSIIASQNDLLNPKNKKTEPYVKTTWLEIACGEGSYIVTRYNTQTGQTISIDKRTGFLDLKLQQINKDVSTKDEWNKLITLAYETSYGLDLQGDSLFLARENLLYSYIEYYRAKWGEEPEDSNLEQIADIISYNVFQMDVIHSEVLSTTEPRIGQISWIEDTSTEPKSVSVYVRDWTTKDSIHIDDFKFDKIVGNPPYQKNDNGKRKDAKQNPSATAIYPEFVEWSKKRSQQQSLLIPSRWISGAGKGTKKFMNSMLDDLSIKLLVVYPDATQVFTDHDIKGGVCYFLRDITYNGDCELTVFDKNVLEQFVKGPKKRLKNPISKTIVLYEQLETILEKVHKKSPLTEANFQTYISENRPYGFRTDFFESQIECDTYNLTWAKDSHNNIGIYGTKTTDEDGTKAKRERVWGYLSKKSVYQANASNLTFLEKSLNKYKLFVPKANGNGKLGEKLAKTEIGKPMDICTETFIQIGPFKTLKEVQHVQKYLETQFFQILLGILKITQDNPKRVWRCIPIQDFTSKSDVPWRESIEKIDAYFCEKYELDLDEKEFIRNVCKS